MQTVSEEEANLDSQPASTPTVCEEAQFLLDATDNETNEENERQMRARRSSGCDSSVEACFLPDSIDDVSDVEIDWTRILEARWKTMEEVLEKRLHEHFTKSMDDVRDRLDVLHESFTKYTHEVRDRLDVQSETQHTVEHKIEALERSCMDLKRKQGKHHTAFVDLRGMTVMLKDILSGILRLVDVLGVSSGSAAKQHSLTSSEESVGSLLSGENFHLACKELAEQVDKMSRQGLWLETREGTGEKLADSIHKELEHTSPTKQFARRESYQQLARTSSPEARSPRRLSQISYESESIPGSSHFGQAHASLVGESFVGSRRLEIHSPSSSPTLTSYRSIGSAQHTLAPAIPNWARTDIGHQSGQQESVVGNISSAGLSKSYSTMSGIGVRNSLGSTRGFSTMTGVSKSTSIGSLRVSLGSARCRSTSPSEATHRPIVANHDRASIQSYSVRASSPPKP